MKATIPWRSSGCSSTTRIRVFATCSPGGAMLSVACVFGISIRKGLRLASQYAYVNWLCSSRIYGPIPCQFFRQSQVNCKEKNVTFLQRCGCPLWIQPTYEANGPVPKAALRGKPVTSIVLEHGADCRLRLSTLA